jgi:SAM-dependent methyltransferase
LDIDSATRWQSAFDAYKALIRDSDHDSEYLRDDGLVPNLLQLIGDVGDLRVLDAGCGTGWLFDNIRPRSGWECDIVTPPPRGVDHVISEFQDVGCLTYDDESFDIVVSSLVLMWVDDLEAVFREAYRVTRPGGRMVVALTHPHFHKNGRVLSDGSFLIDQPLAGVRVQDDVMISGLVGPLRHFARPLLDYYRTALAAGWCLVDFRDYFIDMERYRVEAAHLSTRVRRTDKVPLFTFFVCQK